MDILFEDSHLIIINKPGGLPIQTANTDIPSVVDVLESQYKTRFFLTHRLDQRVTGAMIIAKSKMVQTIINEQLREGSILKKYWALVKNMPPEKKGTLVHYLRKDGGKNKSKAFLKEVKHSKRAELEYEVISQSDHYFLLEITLKTGRHHQIRAQLSAIGSPIKGDIKYGFKRTNPNPWIHLHARSLKFNHPVTNQEIKVIAEPPEDNLWKVMPLFK